MKFKTIFLLLIFASLGKVILAASLKLPNILGDHMVLQQNTTVNIWGWSIPGDPVKVTTGWSEESYSANADPNGSWLVKVPTGDAGGPFSISIQSDTTIELIDILLGEVWICSGQSNMEWPLSKAESAKTEISRSIYPEIRLFTAEKRVATRPNEELQGNWKKCGSGSAREK